MITRELSRRWCGDCYSGDAMGCRCNERKQAIVRGVSAAVRGDAKGAAQSAAYVSRTLIEDARSGALRTAAAERLASLRASLKRS
ncbi:MULTISPECIES: hypothetical protein [unclassified Bradyrhizobium]|uniref:hypothetical protein n=1 Tax=unclassified Bradyrhizobium TaxID=2631580 RepID=UPI0028E5666B|nr:MULTISPECIES: hypothetical protein [unclassified Bradyrhizobium]